MAEITAALVKELREKTGAGMMDCKRALEATGGDIEKAIDYLREKGLAAAAKKAARVAAEGVVVAHVTEDGRVGALVEVNCETDFVAKNEEFLQFAQNVARQVAQEAPADVAALLARPYIAGGGTVEEVLKGLIAKIGENQTVRRFTRYQLEGEGVIASYIHGGGKAGRVGVLVELAGPAVQATRDLAKELTLQIASMRPGWLRREDVPADVVAHEREIERKRALEEGKPADKVDQIAEGRLRKFFEENVLLEQIWVKDNKKKIADVVKEFAKQAGGPIEVRRFVRYEVGEGIEKKADDFAAEVRKMAGG